MEGVPLAIGGVEDHIHLLIGLRSKHRLDYFLRDLKADSSNWVQREFKKKFEWQRGYGAFTVSPLSLEGVKTYISNQEKHHEKKDFQAELIELLKASGIEYDEKYL